MCTMKHKLPVSVISLWLNIINYQCGHAWCKNYMYQSHIDGYSNVSKVYYATATPDFCALIKL